MWEKYQLLKQHLIGRLQHFYKQLAAVRPQWVMLECHTELNSLCNLFRPCIIWILRYKDIAGNGRDNELTRQSSARQKTTLL